MYIDYVRIYQEEGKESVTCDPREFLSVFFRSVHHFDSNISAGFPTTEYIQDHPGAYLNANITVGNYTQ